MNSPQFCRLVMMKRRGNLDQFNWHDLCIVPFKY